MNYSVGDLVFGKVRGYAAWPAQVTQCDVPGGGGERYSVVFFGTKEFANIGAKDLWKYTAVNKTKFASNTHMKKAKFAKAIAEIEKVSLAKDIAEVSIENGEGFEKENVGKEVGAEALQKSKVVEKNKKDKNSKALQHRDTNKHLQEDEARNTKLFREKIVEEGTGFSCRFCAFVSGMLIVAKTHAVKCGTRRKTRRRRPKVFKCIECEETFGKKTTLNEHFKSVHVTSSNICTSCGYKLSSRHNFVRHLRIHDKNYTPSFNCDFCSHKARDNWNLDKHMLSHFKNTDCTSLNSPLNKFSSRKFEVALTEFVLDGVVSSMYRMTVYESDKQEEDLENVIDWSEAADHITASFGQLGLADSDWAEWLEISSIMGLRPYTGCLSWVVHHDSEAGSEVFEICTQEYNDDTAVKEIDHHAFQEIENSGEVLEYQGEAEDHETVNVLPLEEDENIAGGDIDVQQLKFSCNFCEKSFKDNAHLSEHKARMHSEPTPCMICNVVFQDKHSASSHQKTCSRRCPYDNCSFQTGHKFRYMKHLRGHEKLLRRFSNI